MKLAAAHSAIGHLLTGMVNYSDFMDADTEIREESTGFRVTANPQVRSRVCLLWVGQRPLALGRCQTH